MLLRCCGPRRDQLAVAVSRETLGNFLLNFSVAICKSRQSESGCMLTCGYNDSVTTYICFHMVQQICDSSQLPCSVEVAMPNSLAMRLHIAEFESSLL